MADETGFKKWAPLVVMALALFIVVLDTTIINVSFRAVIDDLHSSLKSIQWVVTGYSLMLAAFTITGGRLGDIFGRKKIFLVGAVIFALGSLLASRAHSATWLFLSVAIIEGAGAALMLPATASLLVSTYRGKDRAIAFGVYGAIAGAAATIGPILGGWLTSNYSWRWNYLINPLIVVVLLFGASIIKEARERTPHRPDLLSIVLSALGLGGIVYGIIESSTYGWVKAKQDYEIFGQQFHLAGVSISSIAIIFGLIFLTLFLLQQSMLEEHGKTPLVSTDLLKNKEFMSGTVVLAVAVLGQFGLIFAMPVFLQGLLGKDAFHSGIALLPLSLAILVASPLSGVLAGKRNVPQRHIIQTGLALSVLGGLLLYTEVSSTATVVHLLPGLICFGAGFGLVISQLANVTLSAVDVQMAGEASGVNNTFRQIGTSLGQALIGALLITALVSQLNHDVSASKVLPPSLKPQVGQLVAANAESLGTASDQPKGQLPVAAVAEINRIKNNAIVHGVKTGFLGTTAALAVALALSPTLPLRARQHAYEPTK
ncbi:MAG TPA: MFS transporter [Candidatus Saccharimonadales bacterium]|nr:MFS transporter [Candidatus Saccharimonadales bacterium]